VTEELFDLNGKLLRHLSSSPFFAKPRLPAHFDKPASGKPVGT